MSVKQFALKLFSSFKLGVFYMMMHLGQRSWIHCDADNLLFVSV